MIGLPQWIERWAVHQDFFWFASLLAWSLTLIFWWRQPRHDRAWSWLPWAAGTAIATALIQFGMFNPTFDFFQDRLIPGTVANYRPAAIDPYLLGDILIGVANAIMVAAWWWRVTVLAGRPQLRWLVGPTMAAVVVLHIVDPLGSGWLLSLLALLALVPFWWLQPASVRANLTLLLAALLPVLSTIGPVAALLNSVQRFGPPKPIGLIAATYQAALGLMLLVSWFRRGLARLEPSERRWLWRESRPFLLGAMALLVCGVAFGIVTGRDNRNEIQQNRLRTAAAHAAVFDTHLLLPLENPAFSLEPFSAQHPPGRVYSAALAALDLAPARRALAEVVRSTPFLNSTRILVVRDGWLAEVLSSNMGVPPGMVDLLRRATPADYAAWHAAEPYVEEEPVAEIGAYYYCRAPLLGPRQHMLGWLDCVRSEYYLSVERRWRAAPFLVTALGLVLMAMIVGHRWNAHQQEAALRAAAVADESSRIKTAFLAKVSHELRTPLQSILGYSELLVPELQTEPGRSRLAALRQHGELMTRLVNDLLDLGAIESGGFRLVEKPVQLAALIRLTIESFRPRAEAKGLTLEFQAGPQADAWVMADAERVRQIIINLVGNAVKFTDQGGVRVGFELAADGWARLTVTDTGPGIAPVHQAQVFEAFSRLELTANKEGTGLGLAMVAGLCRSMGGTIKLESEAGQGARFSIHWPLRFTTAPAVLPAGSDAPLAGRRVLIADDNALMRELFTAHLEEAGAHCTAVTNGVEALAATEQENFDVLLLDLAMPLCDGLEVTRRLRANGSTTRIVGVSAHANPRDREQALAAGMNAFLTKPVELAALRTALFPALAGPAKSAGSEALYERLRAQFHADAPAQAAAITGALSRRDWPQLIARSHYLKNSAAVVRAEPLFAACAALEHAASTADTAAAEAAWQECSAALQRWLENKQPAPQDRL